MNYGGVERMALRLISGLTSHGFSHVVIYTGETPGDMDTEFSRLPSVRLVRCPYRRGRRIQFIQSCAKVMRAEKPDKVLAYSFGNHAMVAAASWIARVPVTYTWVHGSPVRNGRMDAKSAVLAHVARPFCRGEIAVSETVAAQLVKRAKLPARRVHVIPNGCETEEIGRRAAAARKDKTENGPWRLIMVSRMDDAKDHPTLLRAVRLLVQEGIDVELLLAGDGPERTDHERMAKGLGIAGLVKFLGNRDDVPELLGEADILVHATHTEGFGIALIEAMAAGTPVVASDIAACREVLNNGECGLLVEPRDPRSITRAVIRLVQDPGLSRKITEMAAARVSDYYDIGGTVERYAELLLEGAEN
jgi:glycosyltransferase involved in cell wall biosynthesis